MKSDTVVIVGLGEVGQPLAKILKRSFSLLEVDITPKDLDQPCSVLHICFPFEIRDFVGTTVAYMDKYKPALTIINSTIAPGTTDAIYQRSGRRPLAYSPVRGKHAKMETDMTRYKKFVAGCDAASSELAEKHFQAAGFKTATFPTPSVGETAKLLETTYLGVLIAWAQEVERIAGTHGGSFKDVNAFIEEIDFLPSHIFPGVIGGHCVMPNIRILQKQHDSAFLDVIVESNEQKKEETATSDKGLAHV